MFGAPSSTFDLNRHTLPTIERKTDTPRFLITLDRGIGDTVLVGLSAVEQIIQNDAAAYGRIDILCTPLQLSKFIRQMVNKYFGRDIPASELGDDVSLYLDTKHIQKAVTVIEKMKEELQVNSENARVLLVAADSSSTVTRPPTRLLAPALANVLRMSHQLIAGILPGYTDAKAPENLKLALMPEFAGRIFMLTYESTSTLLETAALIDQADIFVTGDTGVMHLTSATKKILPAETTAFVPKNSVKIIAIFGGTNPEIWGDSERSLIVGRGRKEQRSFGPGYVKEMYDSRGEDLFDHISPQQLADAIISQL